MDADEIQTKSASGTPVQPIDGDAIKQILEVSRSLQEKCVSLQEQLTDAKNSGEKVSEELANRIDKILTLMTAHAAYIKQLVDLVDDCQGRMNDLDIEGNKRELSYASLIQRQNMFDTRLSQIETSSKNIVAAIKELQDSSLDNKSFQIRTTSLVVVAVSVISWVLAGDNLTKLLVYLHNFFTGQ